MRNFKSFLEEKAPKMGDDYVAVQRKKDAEHAKAMGRSVKTGRKLPTKKLTPAELDRRRMSGVSEDIDEKTLTPAEKKKREEIAKAMERENPGMPMAKKMAIATATAKKVAEVTISPLQKIRMDKEKADRNKDNNAKTQAKRITDKQYAGYKVKMKEEVDLDEANEEWKKDSGWKKPEAVRKDKFGNTIKTKNVAKNLAKASAKKSAEMSKEEVELDELSKKTLGSYVKKASRDVANRSASNARDYAKGNVKPGMNKKAIKNWRREIGIDKAIDRLTK